MSKKYHLLIAECLVLFVCIASIRYGYFINIEPDKIVKEAFKRTDCFLLSKKLTSKGHFFTQYRADFRVSYSVGNVQYTKWIAGNGLDVSFTRNNMSQENILSRFDNGNTYPCWYNPENHEQVVLNMRGNWTAAYSLIIPSAIFILVFYFFTRGVMKVYRGSQIKKSKKRVNRRKK